LVISTLIGVIIILRFFLNDGAYLWKWKMYDGITAIVAGVVVFHPVL